MDKFVFWPSALRFMARNAIELLKLAGEPVTADNLIAMMRSLPRYPEDLRDERWRAGFFNRCLDNAHSRAMDDCGGGGGLAALRLYFLDEFVRLPVFAQQALDDSVIVVLTEFESSSGRDAKAG